MSKQDEIRDATNKKHLERSILFVWLRAIFFSICFIVLLFVPAGRLDWIAGWVFLGFFCLAVSVIAIWVRRHDPELMRERQTSAQAENVKFWDKIIMAFYSVLLIVMLILASVDAGRYSWSFVPLILRVLGWLGLSVAFVIVWWVMAENTYLSERVRIQEDRAHRVVTSGPYQYIRHPMYVGVILAVICLPLALGSLWALIPALLIVFLFVVRTGLEDRTLMEELPGYKLYAERVSFRLIPGIW